MMDFPAAYHALKAHIMSMTGEGQALLHVDIGLAIYLLFQITMGTRRGSLPALASLALFVSFNEIMNRCYFGTWRIEDALRNVALTLLWPTLLVLVSQFRRGLWRLEQSRLKPKFTLKLVAASEPGAAPAMSPRLPPRLRVFPGYGQSAQTQGRPRNPG